MLKKLAVWIILIAMISFSYAYVHLLSPIDAKLAGEEEISIGKMQPAETFELVFSRESGLSAASWDSLEIFLPNNAWEQETEKQDKSFIIKIAVPKDAKQNIYRIGFEFSNNKGIVADQKVYVKAEAKKGLLEFRKKKIEEYVEVNQKAFFEIEIQNSSLADHGIKISSDLSKAWFLPLTETIEAKSTKTISISVTPRTVGIKEFYFKVESVNSGEEITTIDASVEAKPSFASKFSSAAYSLPFMDFALLPQRLIVSLIALLFG